ncbi:MAG TPA: M48 family metalloprotease [Terracidiphilus sp.]|nr:M48 family metalloprotease [Terracidiphilus sp.]
MRVGFRFWSGTALAGMALTLVMSASAQSSTTGDNSSGSTAAQPAPGTTPVTGDSSAPSSSKTSSPSAQQPAPGTTPVTGDQPAPSADNTAPCPTAASDKKEKKDKRDKKDGSGTVDDAEPGLVPLNCAGASKQDSKGFDPDKVVGVGSDMIKIKPGSIEDVSAVGNRDIGGRGLGNWYSTESEIKMGKQYADQVDKSARFITDPVVEEYINRIGQNIVKNSDCKVPFTIKVIDSDEINAFALPGGFFFVNSGLILAADEEAELAGVMAHETAHVCAHHAAREMTRMNYAQLGMIPLIIFTGYSWTGYGIYEAAQLAIPMTFLEFSREFEAQADYLGVQYMYRAGYDPQAFITFFEKIEALEKRKPGLVAKAFSDHPQTPDRILHTQEEIAEILPAKDEYLVTTSEFNQVKARLARIENKRRLVQSNQAKPSLRRASDTTNGGNDTGSGTDTTDRPTLHRRDDQNQN